MGMVSWCCGGQGQNQDNHSSERQQQAGKTSSSRCSVAPSPGEQVPDQCPIHSQPHLCYLGQHQARGSCIMLEVSKGCMGGEGRKVVGPNLCAGRKQRASGGGNSDLGE